MTEEPEAPVEVEVEIEVEGEVAPVEPVAPAEVKMTRDEMRAKIFSAKARSKEIDFFGTRIELRQPTIGVILAQRRGELALDASQMMLMQYAFVPGTNDHVFEEADLDALDELPFGKDMQDLSMAVADLMGSDVKELKQQITDESKSS